MCFVQYFIWVPSPCLHFISIFKYGRFMHIGYFQLMTSTYGSLIQMEHHCKLGSFCISKKFQIFVPMQSQNES